MTPTAIGSSTAAHQNVDAASATRPTPDQEKAARDFEAIFLRQLMSSLEKGGGLGGQSSGGQVFRSMMVSALADTASEGGGIGLRDLILKAMLPPAPQGTPHVSLHAAAPEAAPPDAAASTAVSAGNGSAGNGNAGGANAGSANAGSVGEPAVSMRWGAPSRVLTEARRAPMLGDNATGRAGAIREGNGR
jgi:Rod binding domain-containing protein